MRGGIWVLNVFAALWGVAAVVVGPLPIWLAFLPALLSGVLILWASRQPVGTGNPVEGDHVGRAVGIATGIEGVALFIVANILINLHMPTTVMPAAAIIVGLHFIPLARWIPVPLYYRTAAGLIAVGIATLFMPPLDRAIVTGAGAALVLWVSGIMLVRNGRG